MLGLWSKLLGTKTLDLSLYPRRSQPAPLKTPTTTQAQGVITPCTASSLPILGTKKSNPRSAGLPSASYGLPVSSERSGSGTIRCSPFLPKSSALPAHLAAGSQRRAIS